VTADWALMLMMNVMLATQEAELNSGH